MISLLYITKREIEGDTGSLKEQAIGHAVFRRPQSYDPVTDNIVRVQARHLRQKLEEYFAAEGSDETIVLDIPKGKYVPVYHERGALPQLESASRNSSRTKALAAALVLCLIVAGGAWVATSGVRKAIFWPWTEFLDPQRRTVIVAADATLNYIQKFAGRPVRLQDCTRPNYPQFLFPTGVPQDQADLMAST